VEGAPASQPASQSAAQPLVREELAPLTSSAGN